MRKSQIIIMITAIVIIIVSVSAGTGHYILDRFFTINAGWRMSWGLEVPRPNQSKSVIDNDPSFNGDGEFFTISTYSEKKIDSFIKNKSFKEVDENSLIKLDGYISNFDDGLKSIRGENNYLHDNPVIFKLGDLYYYKKKDDGSYIFAVLNIEHRILYTLEWLQ